MWEYPVTDAVGRDTAVDVYQHLAEGGVLNKADPNTDSVQLGGAGKVVQID